MHTDRILPLFVKEILEAIRDLRTLFGMIVLPLILFPFLLVGLTAWGLRGTPQERGIYRIGIVGESTYLQEALQQNSRFQPQFFRFPIPERQIQRYISLGQLDLVIQTEENFDKHLKENQQASIRLYYDTTSEASYQAFDSFRNWVVDWKTEIVKERIQSFGIEEEVIQPLKMEGVNLATPRKLGGFTLAQFLPFLLIIMALQAAFYPSIDLVVGEKERRTLESLLTTPLTPVEILTGKFLAVSLISLVAVILNLTGTVLAFQILTRSTPGAPIEFTLSPLTFLWMVIFVLPICMLFSAVFMSLSTLSRSVREAHTYLTPVFVFTVLLAGIGIAPGAHFSRAYVFLPIGSLVLLLKDLLLQQANFIPLIIVLILHLLLAFLFLRFAAGLLQSEEILFSPVGFNLQALRKSKPPTALPTLWEVTALFLFLLPLIIWVGSFWAPRSIALALIFTQVGVIFAIPILFLKLLRYNIKETLALHYPGILNLLAGFLVGISGYLLNIFLVFALKGIVPYPQDFEEAMKELLKNLTRGQGLSLLALLPAVCEETLFRGVILSGVRRRFSFLTSVLFIGILFGLFHLPNPLRMITASLLGVLFTGVTLKTGSLFPAIAAHFTVNAISVMATWIEPKWETTIPSAIAFPALLAGVLFFSIAWLLTRSLTTARKTQVNGENIATL